MVFVLFLALLKKGGRWLVYKNAIAAPVVRNRW
jgi:hypothetical protein